MKDCARVHVKYGLISTLVMLYWNLLQLKNVLQNVQFKVLLLNVVGLHAQGNYLVVSVGWWW